MLKSESVSGYRPDIDGMRAVAILMVVGYHVGVPGFAGGFAGVDVFFVISGYLIIGLLEREREATGRIDWAAFYARRVRRLAPAAVAMLLVVLLISFFVLPPLGERQSFAKSIVAAVTSTSNLYFWHIEPVGYFTVVPESTVLLHTWSLSVEEQFYLMLPLAVFLAAVLSRVSGRSGRLALMWVAAVGATGSLWLATWASTTHPTAGFYLPLTRAYEFGLGGIVALVAVPPARRLVSQALGALGVLLVAGSLVFPSPMDAYPGYWAMLPTLGAAALIWSGLSKSSPARVLALPPMVGLGRVSYGWYLWHWPLLGLATVQNMAPLSMSVKAVLALLGLVLALVSYRFVELRFHPASGTRSVSSARPTRSLLVGAVALSVVTTAALAAGYQASYDRENSPKWRTVAQQLGDFPTLPQECLESVEVRLEKAGVPCYLNDFDASRPTVVLWGDSHARQFVPSLLVAVADRNVNLVGFILSSCPPYDPGPEGEDSGRPESAEQVEARTCAQHNRAAGEFVQRVRSRDARVRVVLSGRWTEYPIVDEAMAENVQRGLPSLIANAGRLGVAVDVVAPVPGMERGAPICNARRFRWYDCNVPRVRMEEARSKALTWLATLLEEAARGSHLIDVADDLCDSQTCYSTQNGVMNYYDDNHLSVTKARMMASHFVASVSTAGSLGHRDP